jgi:quercetin dioxygenase-like cupin family protein
MDPTPSSCEVNSRPAADAAAPPESRVLRWRPDFRWEGVPVEAYKAPADHWCGILRASLAGERGERTAFHVRYFEIAPGGFSSLEHHEHEHVVVVLRGRGEVTLGGEVHSLGFGDVVYVAPNEVHQFRNAAGEPFGFLCVVDAQRDRPLPVSPPGRPSS